MALLEQAHGLLCNAPGEGGAAAEAAEWRRLRTDWIDRWVHVIRDQQTKDHNRRVSIGNTAIIEYEERRSTPACDRLVRRAVDADQPQPLGFRCVLGRDHYDECASEAPSQESA